MRHVARQVSIWSERKGGQWAHLSPELGARCDSVGSLSSEGMKSDAGKDVPRGRFCRRPVHLWAPEASTAWERVM